MRSKSITLSSYLTSLTFCAAVLWSQASAAQDISAMNVRTISIYSSGSLSEALAAANEAASAAQKKGIVDAALGTALANKAELLRQSSKAADAIPEFEAAKRAYESIGQTNSAEYATLLNNLGLASLSIGKLDVAEVHLLNSAQIRGKLHPIDPVQLAVTYNNIGDLKVAQTKFEAALDYYNRALQIAPRPSGPGIYANLHIAPIATSPTVSEGALRSAIRDMLTLQNPDYFEIAKAARDMAQINALQRRYTVALNQFNEAEQYSEKSATKDPYLRISILVGKAGALRDNGDLDQADILYASALSQLNLSDSSAPFVRADIAVGQGVSKVRRGDFHSAEESFRTALSLLKSVHAGSSPLAAAAFGNLGLLLTNAGRVSEAMENLETSLKVYRSNSSQPTGTYAAILGNLGLAYLSQHRLSEARSVLEESERINKEVFSDKSTSYASALVNLSDLCNEEGRWTDAKQYAQRALTIVGNDSTQSRANALNNMAWAELSLNQPDAAISHLKEARAIAEALPGNRGSLVGILRNLAAAYQLKDDVDNAVTATNEQVAAVASLYGADSVQAAPVLANLGWFYLEKGSAADALKAFERGNKIILTQLERDWIFNSFDVSVNRKQSLLRDGFTGFAQASAMLKLEGSAALEQAKRSFETAQWVQIADSSYSIGLRAARIAAEDPGLREKLRQRQDVALAATNLQNSLVAMYTAANSDDAAIGRARSELEKTDKLAAELDNDLKSAKEQFMLLAKPSAVSAGEVQKLLEDDEALISILPTAGSRRLEGQTYIWVVTKTEIHEFYSPMSESVIRKFVRVLRCGLDVSLWVEPNTCPNLVETTRDEDDALPFRMDLAYALYWQLLAPTEPYISGKKLLVVSPGELATLPFETLPTKWPEFETKRFASDYSKVDWLIKEHSVSVLPSVASLRLLRSKNDSQEAQKPFAGFGNPTLNGDGSCKVSPLETSCPLLANGDIKLKFAKNETRAVPAKDLLRRGTDRAALAESVANLCPLPATALEINCIVSEVGGAAVLGDRFTKRGIEELSKSGELTKYRVLDFATHGVLPGEEIGRFLEPALVVTPTAEDDGLLRSSDIARLKLNADWIILAACNTGSGSGGMRGLADAFFFAGARGLLVSNWNTNSVATLLLSVGLMTAARDAKLSLADAHRISVLSVISDGKHPQFAHPEFWAPFTVVGGNASRH